MKTFLTLFILTTLLLTAPARAGHAGHDHAAHDHDHAGQAAEKSDAMSTDGTDCKDIINVKVNGLVCDFCARALEKVFSRQDGVAGIKVDLDNGNVVVAMQPGRTLDDALLTELILDSGYNVRSITKGC